MKPKILLQLAAFFVLFIVVGHTIGHFTGKTAISPADKQVVTQMKQHKLSFNNSMRSWGDFYEGFSLDVSLILIVFTVIFSMLSTLAKKHPKVCYRLLWPYLLCFIGFTISSFAYFFIIPGVANLIICVLVISAMRQLRKESKTDTL
jgi:hypothetical protein